MSHETLDSLFAQTARLHHHRAHQLLEVLGLYRGQPPLLYALFEHDGQTHRELADRLQITPATITRMIQRMEKSGFLQRKADARDRRISRVFLTEAGWAVRDKLQAVWDQMEAESFEGFTGEELAAMRGFLNRVCENLNAAR